MPQTRACEAPPTRRRRVRPPSDFIRIYLVRAAASARKRLLRNTAGIRESNIKPWLGCGVLDLHSSPYVRATQVAHVARKVGPRGAAAVDAVFLGACRVHDGAARYVGLDQGDLCGA